MPAGPRRCASAILGGTPLYGSCKPQTSTVTIASFSRTAGATLRSRTQAAPLRGRPLDARQHRAARVHGERVLVTLRVQGVEQQGVPCMLQWKGLSTTHLKFQ